MSYDFDVRGTGAHRDHRDGGHVPRSRKARKARDDPGTARRAAPRDRGQVAIEYLGFLPILILVALAGAQIGLIAYSAQQAGTAARAGARAASLDDGAQNGCARAISDWLTVTCSEARGGDTVTVTATVRIPSIVPGWDFDDARKTATMPLDH